MIAHNIIYKLTKNCRYELPAGSGNIIPLYQCIFSQIFGFLYHLVAGNMTVVALPVGTLLVAFTVASIWFLSRPSFGRACRQYRDQKQSGTTTLEDINKELMKNPPKL